MSRTSFSSLTAGRIQAPRSVSQSAELILLRLGSDVRISTGGIVQLARADVHGHSIIIRPEKSDFPTLTVPNNVGAEGFSPGIFSHDYVVLTLAPPSLVGQAGLTMVGEALAADPTPGNDGPPSGKGTRNDVGSLVFFDGGNNFVRTYTIASSDRRRSLTVVNYTIQGEHAMSEGFVLRLGRLRTDGRIILVTYGEGNAIWQSEATGFLWRREVERVWTENAKAIFLAARRGMR